MHIGRHENPISTPRLFGGGCAVATPPDPLFELLLFNFSAATGRFFISKYINVAVHIPRWEWGVPGVLQGRLIRCVLERQLEARGGSVSSRIAPARPARRYTETPRPSIASQCSAVREKERERHCSRLNGTCSSTSKLGGFSFFFFF